jgi:hypothetical protein
VSNSASYDVPLEAMVIPNAAPPGQDWQNRDAAVGE